MTLDVTGIPSVDVDVDVAAIGATTDAAAATSASNATVIAALKAILRQVTSTGLVSDAFVTSASVDATMVSLLKSILRPMIFAQGADNDGWKLGTDTHPSGLYRRKVQTQAAGPIVNSLGAYTAGDCLGGSSLRVSRLSNGGNARAEIDQITVVLNEVPAVMPDLRLTFFASTTNRASWVDNAVPTIVAADVPNLQASLVVPASAFQVVHGVPIAVVHFDPTIVRPFAGGYLWSLDVLLSIDSATTFTRTDAIAEMTVAGRFRFTNAGNDPYN